MVAIPTLPAEPATTAPTAAQPPGVVIFSFGLLNAVLLVYCVYTIARHFVHPWYDFYFGPFRRLVRALAVPKKGARAATVEEIEVYAKQYYGKSFESITVSQDSMVVTLKTQDSANAFAARVPDAATHGRIITYILNENCLFSNGVITPPLSRRVTVAMYYTVMSALTILFLWHYH